MPRPQVQVTPPSARAALLVFAAAIVAGTALVLGAHRALHAAGIDHPSFAAPASSAVAPAHTAAGTGGRDHATP